MKDILPTCPYCASQLAETWRRWPDEFGRETVRTECGACGGQWQFFKSQAWNMRTWTLGIAHWPRSVLNGERA